MKTTKSYNISALSTAFLYLLSHPICFPSVIVIVFSAERSGSLLSLRKRLCLSTLVDFCWSKQFLASVLPLQCDCWGVSCSVYKRWGQTTLQAFSSFCFCVCGCCRSAGFWLPLPSLREPCGARPTHLHLYFLCMCMWDVWLVHFQGGVSIVAGCEWRGLLCAPTGFLCNGAVVVGVIVWSCSNQQHNQQHFYFVDLIFNKKLLLMLHNACSDVSFLGAPVQQCVLSLHLPR